MANEEHLKILRQGVETWNEWRESNSDMHPDLSHADVSDAYLSNAYLVGADLTNVDLTRANLTGAYLSNAYLMSADLSNADLTGANLTTVNLSGANLIRANLCGADLSFVNLIEADLSNADLTETYLTETLLIGANLESTHFEKAHCQHTVFANVDLSTVKGLETVIHEGPSTIGIDTLFKSGGKIPESFLRGCGIPENVIASLPILLAGGVIQASDVPRTIQNDSTAEKPERASEPKSQLAASIIPPTAPLTRDKVFISYSHKDAKWLDRLTNVLHPVRERLNIWDDTQIKPGTKWAEEIEKALSEAKAAVLLVSPDFLRSDFITRKELPPILKAAQEEGLKILWVAVSASLYSQTIIGQYQSLNNPSKPLDKFKSASDFNKELVRIAEEIMKAMDGQ